MVATHHIDGRPPHRPTSEGNSDDHHHKEPLDRDRPGRIRQHRSDTSDWKLVAKPRDGGLEIEFEVDSNVNGQRWQVSITDNGARVFQGSRTTVAPSGSFDVSVNTTNRPGADKIVAKATNKATGETCLARVTHP